MAQNKAKQGEQGLLSIGGNMLGRIVIGGALGFTRSVRSTI